jgi:hypothetical protein
MTTQDPNSVKPANQPSANQSAKAKGGTQLTLNFDPDLIFDINPNPLALGETDMNIHARASLHAQVTLSKFMGRDYGPADLLNAAIDVVARRCSVATTGTTLSILGQNVDLRALGVPIFDTAVPDSDPDDDDGDNGGSLYQVSKACTDALREYQVVAGRVKKAYRDAQQLLNQYRSVTKLLTGNLCAMLASAPDLSDFPGGAKCYTNEPAEAIINRFVSYYQAPGIGQVTKLRGASSLLSVASGKIKNVLASVIMKDVYGGENALELTFADKSHQETQTIVSVPFAIGPIPCLLQIDLSTNYGVRGNFALDLRFPTDIDAQAPAKGQEPPPSSRVAHVTASVVPYASAALAAFVGAGTDYGPFSATLGIEGRVYLAEAQAPIFAGAGVSMQVLNDPRPVPSDSKPPISIAEDAFQFGKKAFKFTASYDYGMRLDVTKVLSGELSARLRIKFCFFSRTWRKRVIKFNGLEFHHNFISGGGSLGVTLGGRGPDGTPRDPPAPGAADDGTTSVASGSATLGRSESEVPLMKLAYLPIPASGSGSGVQTPDGGVSDEEINPGAVGSFLYDNQCCAKPDNECQVDGKPYPPCCPGAHCAVPDAGGSGNCVQDCRALGQNCKADGPPPCCGGIASKCGTFGVCIACRLIGQSCSSAADCCSGTGCDDLTKKCYQIIN